MLSSPTTLPPQAVAIVQIGTHLQPTDDREHCDRSPANIVKDFQTGNRDKILLALNDRPRQERFYLGRSIAAPQTTISSVFTIPNSQSEPRIDRRLCLVTSNRHTPQQSEFKLIGKIAQSDSPSSDSPLVLIRDLATGIENPTSKPSGKKDSNPVTSKDKPSDKKDNNPVASKDKPSDKKDSNPVASKDKPSDKKDNNPIASKDKPSDKKDNNPVASKEKPSDKKDNNPTASKDKPSDKKDNNPVASKDKPSDKKDSNPIATKDKPGDKKDNNPTASKDKPSDKKDNNPVASKDKPSDKKDNNPVASRDKPSDKKDNNPVAPIPPAPPAPPAPIAADNPQVANNPQPDGCYIGTWQIEDLSQYWLPTVQTLTQARIENPIGSGNAKLTFSADGKTQFEAKNFQQKYTLKSKTDRRAIDEIDLKLQGQATATYQVQGNNSLILANQTYDRLNTQLQLATGLELTGGNLFRVYGDTNTAPTGIPYQCVDARRLKIFVPAPTRNRLLPINLRRV
jgi:hypothetical protein